MDIDTVLEDYRKGDADHRMRLFLAFRDLRVHFGRIDDEAPTDDLGFLTFPWTRNRKKGHGPREHTDHHGVLQAV